MVVKELLLLLRGALNLERFKDKCTGCHLCVVKCPSRFCVRPDSSSDSIIFYVRMYLIMIAIVTMNVQSALRFALHTHLNLLQSRKS